MKKNCYIAYMLLFIAPLHAQPADEELRELCCPESVCVLEVEEPVRAACSFLTKSMSEEAVRLACPELIEFLHCTTTEIDAETALKALEFCLHADCCTDTRDVQELRAALQEVYEELLDEYSKRITQTCRRIRIKFFNKVTTNELIVNSTAYLNNTTVQGNLVVGRLNGAVIAKNGLITTGQIPASAIPDGAITNPKLAANSINTNNIVPMAITPNLLSFNTVQTFASEPNPLKIYRGSVNGTTGAVTSGLGFTSLRTGAGQYTISITGPGYTDNTSYQVFIQQIIENNPVDPTSIVFVSGAQFTVDTTVDHDFSFFTIGS